MTYYIILKTIMLSRLKVLEGHVTGLPAGTENLLEKYRKMSKLDVPLIEDIYYIGNKETVEFYEKPLLENPAIFKYNTYSV